MLRPVDRLVALGYRRKVRGTGRLARLLYASNPSRSIPATVNGLRWEADPLDWQALQIISPRSHEQHVTDTLADLLPTGGVLWDVGANSGVHALTVKHRRPDVTVVAFEPSPAQCARLRHNARANALEVEALCMALAASPGYRRLSVQDDGHSGISSLRPWANSTYTGSLLCWSDAGDNLVASGVPAPSVIKIDVEGGEGDVLTGMGGLLAGASAVVFESDLGEQPALAGFTVEPLDEHGNWLARR